MYLWFEQEGYEADIEAVRSEIPNSVPYQITFSNTAGAREDSNDTLITCPGYESGEYLPVICETQKDYDEIIGRFVV